MHFTIFPLVFHLHWYYVHHKNMLFKLYITYQCSSHNLSQDPSRDDVQPKKKNKWLPHPLVSVLV